MGIKAAQKGAAAPKAPAGVMKQAPKKPVTGAGAKPAQKTWGSAAGKWKGSGGGANWMMQALSQVLAGKGSGKSGRWGGKKAPALPKDFEFDGEARHMGTVTNYSKFKGYGFIKPDEEGLVPGGKPLYVYWKSIKSDDRFPSLQKDMQVEFGLARKRVEGAKGSFTLCAKQVSLPGGGQVAVQDEVDAKKNFVGGQHLRYSGTLKFFNPKTGFGYITLDEGYDVPEAMPKEIRVETAEVNAGGRQPQRLKDVAVEFGIWETKKGAYKAYNMTLPGGSPLTMDALEHRQVVPRRTFKGKIVLWYWKQGFGYIEPAATPALPANVTAKLSETEKALKSKGTEQQHPRALYFRRGDLQKGFRAERDAAVSFQVYTDDKGAGACEIQGA
mmetsp:Transcript_68430/g.190877  ORF Transcript_68430/g.190877 Transcript_68430/m.190877 type:complete len:385 (+) Transcript_68430:92-1246(+)